MSFVDELLKNSGGNRSAEAVSMDDIIRAIKQECSWHSRERKIDGYFRVSESYDSGNRSYGVHELPRKYTDVDVWSGRLLDERPLLYNSKIYGKYLFRAEELPVNFEGSIHSELKKLGFINFKVQLVPVTEEVGIIRKGFAGTKIKYESTGERGYLIKIQISW